MPSTLPGSVLRFGDFELDCGRFELRRKGQSLRVERKPMELLILLAAREGRLVTRTEIAERLWSSEVFVDTEHGINTAIRKLRYLLRDDPDDPHFIKTVTGMGYRFVAPIILVEPQSGESQNGSGIDPATAPSTPDLEEPKKEDAPELTAVPAVAAPRKHRPWLAVTVSAATLITIFAVALDFRPLVAHILHRNATPAINSLAVLPLDNLSGNPNQDYFADGMTDELITMLAKNSTLRITSRTSVMRFKGTHKPLPEISRELGVDAILEGSVAQSENQVHMTLQLIRADTDTHLWADSYDRRSNDAALLPDEAARQITDYLHKTASTAVSVRSVSPDAHDAYLRGKYIWFTGSNEEAGKYFREATELQPDYALGWSGLAVYYGAGMMEGALDPRQARGPGMAAATKAVQLDDSLAEAHLALGGAYICEWNTGEAEKELNRAIQLNPNLAEAYHLRARLDLALNRESEAIESQRKAMELDPLERPWAMVWTLMTARQYDAAIQEARERLATLPNNDSIYWELGQTYDRKDDVKDAVQAWVKMEEIEGHSSNAAKIGKAYAQGGRAGLIRTELDAYKKDTSGAYVSPVDLAALHARLGERELTLSLLEEAYRQHSPQLLWIQTDPAFDFLHSDPRYRAIVQRLGLPAAY